MKRALPKLKPFYIRFAIILLALILCAAGCSTFSEYLVNKHDQAQPRDGQTGVLIGAEAHGLGDPNAPCVAVMVHGFGGSGNNFNELPQRIADMGWRVKVMRLPGHGTSPFDLAPVTPSQLIHAVTSEITSLRSSHETIVLIGHSMGGALSAIAASITPVDGLALGGAYFGVSYKWYYILPPETWTAMLSPCLHWVYKSDRFIQVNRREVKDQILSYRWLPTAGVKTLVALGDQANLPETLGAIHCPALMLHGPGDDAAAFECAKHAFDQMASENKTFVALERSNHHVFWDYDWEAVNDSVLRFLKQIESPAADQIQ